MNDAGAEAAATPTTLAAFGWVALVGAAHAVVWLVGHDPHGVLTHLAAYLTLPLQVAPVLLAGALLALAPGRARGWAIGAVVATAAAVIVYVVGLAIDADAPRVSDTVDLAIDLAAVTARLVVVLALGAYLATFGLRGGFREALAAIAAIGFVIVRVSPEGDRPAETALQAASWLAVAMLAFGAPVGPAPDDAASARGFVPTRRLVAVTWLHLGASTAMGVAYVVAMLDHMTGGAYTFVAAAVVVPTMVAYLATPLPRRWPFAVARTAAWVIIGLEIAEVTLTIVATDESIGLWWHAAHVGHVSYMFQAVLAAALWLGLAGHARIVRSSDRLGLLVAAAGAGASVLMWIVPASGLVDGDAALIALGCVDTALWLVMLVLVLRALRPPVSLPVGAFD